MGATVRPAALAGPAGTGGRVRHGVAAALVHELPPVALMWAACAAGGAAALCAGAVALALLSIGYARAARTAAFAREHLVDLWAMVLLLVGAAFAGAASPGPTPAGHHHLAALATAPLAVALTAAAVTGWVLARAALALRVRRAHTLVSALVCGGMLAAMLVL